MRKFSVFCGALLWFAAAGATAESPAMPAVGEIIGDWEPVQRDWYPDGWKAAPSFEPWSEWMARVEAQYRQFVKPAFDSYRHDLVLTLKADGGYDLQFSRFFNGKPARLKDNNTWEYSPANTSTLSQSWKLTAVGFQTLSPYAEDSALETVKQPGGKYLSTYRIEWRTVNGERCLFIAGLGVFKRKT